ncbi:MAG: energy transducer TonB [Burkholderiales bacterium]|nr:energy transducer TonB [Burkholderiales bacterium]
MRGDLRARDKMRVDISGEAISRGCAAMLLIGTLTACSTPPSATLSGLVVRSYPAIQPGCLLPDKALFVEVPRARTIDLRLQVEADGRASSAVVANSTGSARLDEAFIAAALKCRYTPATAQDKTAIAHTHLMTQTWIPGQSFTGPQRCFLPDYPPSALRNAQSVEVRVRFMAPAALDAPAQVLVVPGTDPLLAAPSKASASACLMHPEARQGLKAEQWYEVSFHFRVHS